LAERLIGGGHEVLGIDAFTEYYLRHLKERNIGNLLRLSDFRLVEADLTTADLPALIGALPGRRRMDTQRIPGMWERLENSRLTHDIV
jgi:nucleoside-diphosphate-sugar epimerase